MVLMICIRMQFGKKYIFLGGYNLTSLGNTMDVDAESGNLDAE